MTIPTRAEMIERWRACHFFVCQDGKDHRGLAEIGADFALAEGRRLVAEELEALREHLRGEGYFEYSYPVRHVGARLAALRQTEQPLGSSTERARADAAPQNSARTEQAPQGQDAGSTPAPGATCCDRAAQEMEAKMDEELHAVRMEAQVLREANASWDFTCQKLIGWIQWRQAWTGGNDPRDLSGTRWDICALRGDAPPRGFMGCTPPPGAATAAERLDALREQESGYYETAGVTGPGSESVKVREQAERAAARSGRATGRGGVNIWTFAVQLDAAAAIGTAQKLDHAIVAKLDGNHLRLYALRQAEASR